MYICPIANYLGEQQEASRARIDAYYTDIRAKQEALLTALPVPTARPYEATPLDAYDF